MAVRILAQFPALLLLFTCFEAAESSLRTVGSRFTNLSIDQDFSLHAGSEDFPFLTHVKCTVVFFYIPKVLSELERSEAGAHPGWRSCRQADKDSASVAVGWRVTHWEARALLGDLV